MKLKKLNTNILNRTKQKPSLMCLLKTMFPLKQTTHRETNILQSSSEKNDFLHLMELCHEFIGRFFTGRLSDATEPYHWLRRLEINLSIAFHAISLCSTTPKTDVSPMFSFSKFLATQHYLSTLADSQVCTLNCPFIFLYLAKPESNSYTFCSIVIQSYTPWITLPWVLLSILFTKPYKHT